MKFLHCFGAGMLFTSNLHSQTFSEKKHSAAILFSSIAPMQNKYFCTRNSYRNNAYLVNSFATAGKTLVLGIGQKLFRFFSLQIINASQSFWYIA